MEDHVHTEQCDPSERLRAVFRLPPSRRGFRAPRNEDPKRHRGKDS